MLLSPAEPSRAPDMEASAIDRAYAECEQLAGRDKPHLYAAAHLFGHADVRRAFVATYASMRIVDDAVDGISHRSSLSPEKRQTELAQIQRWLDLVELARRGDGSAGPTWTALADTFSRFEIPIDPWSNLAKAMSSDVVSSSFKSWEDLRKYMQGASVAPAVVFMYLVLMSPGEAGKFRCEWEYPQVLAATEDLAVFCYCVHILRDVAADLSLGGSGLIYLPEEDLRRFGLSAADLHAMNKNGRADASYVLLAQDMAKRARLHLARGQLHMSHVLKAAEPSNGRALSTLVQTYERILNKLQDIGFDVFCRLSDS